MFKTIFAPKKLATIERYVSVDELIEELCARLLPEEDELKTAYDELVCEYIGVERDCLIGEHKSFPSFHRNLVLVAVTSVIEKYYKQGLAFSINDFDDSQMPPRYIQVSCSPTEQKKCLFYGFIQIEKDGERFLVNVDCTDRTPYFDVITAENKTELATEFVKLVEKYMNECNMYRGQIIQIDKDGYLDFMSIKEHTWNDVIIPEEIKNELIYNTLWPVEKRDIFLKNGLPTKRGIMLSGKPGVGKTMVISVIANMMHGKATVIWVPHRSISSADDIAIVYNAARELAPSVVIFEDIDLIAMDRESMGNYSPILGELLGQLDGLENNDSIITVATTNHPEAVETALKDRPSRFDRLIQLDLPDTQARRQMLNIFTQEIRLGDDVDLDKIAEYTNGFTGAYLRELATTAVIEAIRELESNGYCDGDIIVYQRHLMRGVEKFKRGNKLGLNIERSR